MRCFDKNLYLSSSLIKEVENSLNWQSFSNNSELYRIFPQFE